MNACGYEWMYVWMEQDTYTASQVNALLHRSAQCPLSRQLGKAFAKVWSEAACPCGCAWEDVIGFQKQKQYLKQKMRFLSGSCFKRFSKGSLLNVKVYSSGVSRPSSSLNDNRSETFWWPQSREVCTWRGSGDQPKTDKHAKSYIQLTQNGKNMPNKIKKTCNPIWRHT